MEFENLLLEQKGAILKIIVNRPKSLNALDSKTMTEIETVIVQVYDDDSIFGVIFTGAGEKAFVAGADITEFLMKGDNEGQDISENGQRVFRLIEDCPKPVIAAVNGFALGGGCELAMACHIRIASENAKFGQPEVKLGLIPGYGGTQRLIHCVGKSKAIELMMTGDFIDAQEAKKLGLVSHVYNLGELIWKAEEMLARIIKYSPVALSGIIKAVKTFYQGDEDGFEKESEIFAQCFAAEDKNDGVTAFLEKRDARYR